MRYLLVTVEGGIVQTIEPYKSFREAKIAADYLSQKFDPEGDDMVVWDLQKGVPAYNPFK